MPELLNMQGTDHDQLTIDTPEQVSIRFPVSGLGSRFLALLADSVVQGIAYLVLILILMLVASSAPKTTGGGFARGGEKWLFAGLIILHFVMYWGYFTLFETFWNGQTPGKKLCKIRVIQQSGRQITFFEAMTRNLLRAVDMLPGLYLAGAVTMLCNRQHQRLGDLAAGTLVVHERSNDEPVWSTRTITAAAFERAAVESAPEPYLRQPDPELLPADAVARLSAEDLAIIDRFFSRILDMELETRARISERLAAQMSKKMNLAGAGEAAASEAVGGEAGIGEAGVGDRRPERLLEAVARQMRGQGKRF